MWNLKIHTIIHMRSVYILYSNEICECALWSHGGEKTLKLSAQFFFKKYSKTKTGSFKTQICPKVESPTSPFWNWPPSQNVTVDKFQNTSIPSSKTFLATTTWQLLSVFGRTPWSHFDRCGRLSKFSEKWKKKEDLEATQRATVFCLLPQLPNEWFFDLKVMLAWWERIKILK